MQFLLAWSGRWPNRAKMALASVGLLVVLSGAGCAARAIPPASAASGGHAQAAAIAVIGSAAHGAAVGPSTRPASPTDESRVRAAQFADRLFDLGLYSLAAEEYAAMVGSDESLAAASVRLRLIEALLRAGRVVEAQQALTDLERRPVVGYVELMLLKAAVLAATGKREEAEDLLTDRIELGLGDARLWVQRGYLRMSLPDHGWQRRGALDLEEALVRDDSLSLARRRLVLWYLEHDMTVSALPHLRELAAQTKWPADLKQLAGLEAILQHWDRAAAAYEQALQVDPADAVSRNHLAFLKAEKLNRPEDALALADAALRADPSNPEFLDTAGWVHWRLGRRHEAEVLLNESLRIDRRPAALMHLAKLRLAQGRTAEARALLREAYGHAPQHAPELLRELEDLLSEIET